MSRFDAPLEGSNEGPGNILADNADHGKVCFPGDGFSTSRQRTTSTPFDELKMAIAEMENAVTALQDRLHEKQVQASSTEEQITPLLDDDNGKLSKKPDAVTQATTRSARQHQKSTVAEDKLDDLTVKVLKNFLLDPDKLTLNSGGVGASRRRRRRTRRCRFRPRCHLQAPIRTKLTLLTRRLNHLSPTCKWPILVSFLSHLIRRGLISSPMQMRRFKLTPFAWFFGTVPRMPPGRAWVGSVAPPLGW